jgi:hypothetical protein
MARYLGRDFLGKALAGAGTIHSPPIRQTCKGGNVGGAVTASDLSFYDSNLHVEKTANRFK